MINIAKKKLPIAVVVILIYLSYCAMSWYISRGTIAYYGAQYGIGKWFVNDIWAFFIGGLVPFALYMIISRIVCRSLMMRTDIGDIESLRYGLNITIITVNVILFLIKFIYFAFPLQASAIDIVITPILTIVFVAVYLFYAFKQNYVEKSRYRFVVSQIMGAFLAVYGFLTFINLILAVVA